MNKKYTSFDKVFYFSSFIYLVYFYILPLYIVQNYSNSINISYNLEITNDNLLTAYISLLVFIFGFITLDILKLVFKNNLTKKSKKSLSQKSLSQKNKVLIFILVIFYFIYILYTFLTTSTDEIYAVKKGLTQGSWLKYFFSIILQGIKYSIIFILIKINIKKKYLVSILLFSIFIELNSGIGRFDLLLDIIILFMVVFNISAFKMNFIIFVGIFISLPLLFSLKSIIYMVATDTLSIDSIIKLLQEPFDFNIYLNNFGHPLVSLLMIDSLIEKMGYRYFYDYIHDFVFYFKILGFSVDGTITYYNTDNLLGKYESIVPPGYLAYGYIQLNLLGVYISGMIFRYIGIIGKTIYYKLEINSEAIKFIIAFLFANTFYHGEIRLMILALFLKFIVVLVIFSLFTRKRKSRCVAYTV